jgi:hypothetical protein
MISLGVTHKIEYRVLDCDRPEKYSKHIYGDLVVDRKTMFMIAEFIHRQINGFDLAIYNTKGNESKLRTIGSIKIKDGVIMTKRLLIPSTV